MKTTIFNKLLCTSLMLAFVVGCGKEQKSGSAPAAAAPVVNPVVANVINPTLGNLSEAAKTALSGLNAWYAASEQPTAGFRGTFTKKQSAATSASFNAGFSLCLGSLISYNCPSEGTAPAPTHCYVKNADGVSYNVGTPNVSATASFGCGISQTAVTKASNVELNKALNNPGMTLLKVEGQNGFYNLYYGNYNVNGYPQIQVVYSINTNVHSILNPVRVQDSQGTLEVLNPTAFNY